MKRTIFYIVFALSSAGANAQTSDNSSQDKSTKFGVKAGIGMSFLTTKGGGVTETSSPNIAVFIGGLAERYFSEKLGYRVELGYASLGGTTSDYDYSNYPYTVSSENNTSLGALMFSANFKYYFIPSLSVLAGFNGGYIFSAKNKWKATVNYESASGKTEVDSDSGEKDISDNINPIGLFSPLIGIEYCEKVGLFIDVKYNFGISNLLQDPPSGYTMTNNFLLIGLGYKFGGR